MSLYERLGLSNDADSNEIRKAYLKLSKTEHPDKGGDAERFKSLQQAYEVLSDDQSRSFYDQTGQVPGEQQGNGGGGGMPGGMPFHFPFNMGGMGSMFGNMFMRREQQPQKQQKPPPKIHEIGLTLNDFFYGKRLEIKFERQKFCVECKGAGADHTEICGPCVGAGVRESHMMIGPGMVAVTRGPCDQCNGSGKRLTGICSGCRGSKFTSQEKVLSVNIEPGMVPGDILKFPNECSDNHLYEEPGDVHIILREADNISRIVRIEDTLHATHTISLAEGLLGTKCIIKGHPAHPNGLTVDIPVGTMRGDTIIVEGEGMPRRGTTRRGNLNISILLELKPEEKASLLRNKELVARIFT
jgi:DnaJ-class molecular chaperone